MNSWGAYGLCPKSGARRARAPQLPWFILLGSLNDTLLCPEGVINNSYENYGVLFNLGLTLSRLWGSLWAASKVERSARAKGRELFTRLCLAFRCLSCWEASVTLYS